MNYKSLTVLNANPFPVKCPFIFVMQVLQTGWLEKAVCHLESRSERVGTAHRSNPL